MAGFNKRQISKSSMVYIAIGVLLIAVMTVVGTSAFMSTTGFIVEGASLYTAEEVIEASGLSVGNNLLFVNAQNASENIRNALPFVGEVHISRLLPDIIHIEITESIAVAYILFAGEYYITDSSGRVLERVTGREGASSFVKVEDLIEMRGVEIEETAVGRSLRPVFGTETKLQYMQDVLIALEREGLIDDVSYLDVSNIVNVHFGYLGIYRVIFIGTSNMRPSNLRHNIGRLTRDVEDTVESYPNTPGHIIYNEDGSVEFKIP